MLCLALLAAFLAPLFAGCLSVFAAACAITLSGLPLKLLGIGAVSLRIREPIHAEDVRGLRRQCGLCLRLNSTQLSGPSSGTHDVIANDPRCVANEASWPLFFLRLPLRSSCVEFIRAAAVGRTFSHTQTASDISVAPFQPSRCFSNKFNVAPRLLNGGLVGMRNARGRCCSRCHVDACPIRIASTPL